MDGGVSDDDARQMFDAASRDLQAARDGMPEISSLTDAQRATVLEALAALREAAQRLHEEVLNSTT